MKKSSSKRRRTALVPCRTDASNDGIIDKLRQEEARALTPRVPQDPEPERSRRPRNLASVIHSQLTRMPWWAVFVLVLAAIVAVGANPALLSVLATKLVKSMIST